MMRAALISMALLIGTPLLAQKPLLHDAATVRDSVMATIARDLAEGLWAEERANGALKGLAVLEMVIDEKGRCESVRMVESDLPITWKNVVKDQWFDRRFPFKLAKYHKERITVELRFPWHQTNTQPHTSQP